MDYRNMWHLFFMMSCPYFGPFEGIWEPPSTEGGEVQHFERDHQFAIRPVDLSRKPENAADLKQRNKLSREYVTCVIQTLREALAAIVPAEVEPQPETPPEPPQASASTSQTLQGAADAIAQTPQPGADATAQTPQPMADVIVQTPQPTADATAQTPQPVVDANVQTPVAPASLPPIPRRLTGMAVRTTEPAQNRPVTTPAKPVPLRQKMSISADWPAVPCQQALFPDMKYRQATLYHFGKFSTKAGFGADPLTTVLANYYQGYEDPTPVDPIYLVAFKWDLLLEAIFSSASYLQFCQDEPGMRPTGIPVQNVTQPIWKVAADGMCQWPESGGYFPKEWV